MPIRGWLGTNEEGTVKISLLLLLLTAITTLSYLGAVSVESRESKDHRASA
jgi:hypothetical protein